MCLSICTDTLSPPCRARLGVGILTFSEYLAFSEWHFVPYNPLRLGLLDESAWWAAAGSLMKTFYQTSGKTADAAIDAEKQLRGPSLCLGLLWIWRKPPEVLNFGLCIYEQVPKGKLRTPAGFLASWGPRTGLDMGTSCLCTALLHSCTSSGLGKMGG